MFFKTHKGSQILKKSTQILIWLDIKFTGQLYYEENSLPKLLDGFIINSGFGWSFFYKSEGLYKQKIISNKC